MWATDISEVLLQVVLLGSSGELNRQFLLCFQLAHEPSSVWSLLGPHCLGLSPVDFRDRSICSVTCCHLMSFALVCMLDCFGLLWKVWCHLCPLKEFSWDRQWTMWKWLCSDVCSHCLTEKCCHIFHTFKQFQTFIHTLQYHWHIMTHYDTLWLSLLTYTHLTTHLTTQCLRIKVKPCCTESDNFRRRYSPHSRDFESLSPRRRFHQLFFSRYRVKGCAVWREAGPFFLCVCVCGWCVWVSLFEWMSLVGLVGLDCGKHITREWRSRWSSIKCIEFSHVQSVDLCR